MPANSLIDLFVPTPDPHDASVSVAMAGLDSGVLVFSDPRALAAFESSGPTPMHAALQLEMEGVTLLVLLPSCEMEDHAPLLDLDRVDEVQSAVDRKNGCVVVAGGHMVGDDVVSQANPILPSRAGHLVHMVWRSMLARDLSFEDAALTGRRLLGGTGPQGSLEAVGRYATLLPVDPADRGALISALKDGLGIGVERSVAVEIPVHQEPRKKRRRRRRRRSPQKPEDGSGSADSSGNLENQD